MARGAATREGFATAEAAFLAAAAETPATLVALPPSTVPDSAIPSWENPMGHRLLFGDPDWISLFPFAKPRVVHLLASPAGTTIPGPACACWV